MARTSRDQENARPSGAVAREYLEADEVPDLFCDEFWFASGPTGGILTLIAVIPPRPGDTTLPKGRILGRVRMPPHVAVDLARIINEQITVVPVEPSSGPKN